MIHKLKSLLVFLSIPMLFAMTIRPAKNQFEEIIATARGQQIQIKHSGCRWIRIEYSTTDWRCRGTNCELTGTVTWHDVTIDTRNKAKIFYYEAARGPRSVSKVEVVNVLDSECK
jgi:hypothetical protein